LDGSGAARMVDVSNKSESHRTATAAGRVRLSQRVCELVAQKALPKGILAAKKCGELIPLCHPLPLTDVQVELALTDSGVAITATASCVGRTGVEMEALTAVTVAALTVYDMCKSADKGIVVEEVRLLTKTGGKSGDWHAEL
jgi:cyclic pyranopterin monophosphate synthase